MYSENEKDFIIDSEGELHFEDDTASWDDVLQEVTDDDSDTASTGAIAGFDIIQDDDEPSISQDTVVDLDGDYDLIQQNPDQEDDEEAIRQILENKAPSPKQQAFDTFGNGEVVDEEGNQFNIEDQIAAVGAGSSAKDKVTNRKKEVGIKPAKGSSAPLLIAVLLFVVIAGGAYYYFNFFAEDDFGQQDIQVKQTVQDELNNTSKEEIEKRAQEKIDVVKEEDASKIKPEEKEEEEQEEKKDIITVVPTGRDNPFMPTTKYLQPPVKYVSYDKVNIPKPPKEYGAMDETRDKLLTIAVSGIMYDDQRPSAIITYENNDYFVQKGDRLDNYKVIDINRNNVLISLGSDVYRASIGEEFKISSKFEGNAQFLNSKQGGGKQYYSVNSLNKTETPSVVPNYVSENEIEIKSK